MARPDEETSVKPARRGFTLVEMLTVCGIIVLFIGLAVPTIRVLTGNRSISLAKNQLSAILVRAREEAVALQDIRGVLFYHDSSSDRVVAIMVQPAALQPSAGSDAPDKTAAASNVLMLDLLPNRDSVELPNGISVQTALSPMTPPGLAKPAMVDRYLGFNPVPSLKDNPAPSIDVGGCILFDGSGRLISRPYGFAMTAPPTTPGDKFTNICALFAGVPAPGNPASGVPGTVTRLNNYASIAGASANGSFYEYIPGMTHGGVFPSPPATSQLGLVLFDHEVFKSQGFTDEDAVITGQGYATAWSLPATPYSPQGDGTQSEQAEENWLDQNSTPIEINRYNGTLIQGQ